MTQPERFLVVGLVVLCGAIAGLGYRAAELTLPSGCSRRDVFLLDEPGRPSRFIRVREDGTAVPLDLR